MTREQRRILVSGLVNVETSVRVRQFPINYYPIDYPFFGIQSTVSGVACNVARALTKLGSSVQMMSMTGKDTTGTLVYQELENAGVDTAHILPFMTETPCSVVLYDETGRRQVYSDMKDMQEQSYPFDESLLADIDAVVACNVNFNRPLLAMAKATGKLVATDVHVLSRVDDEYNRDFLQAADVLFLSDEGVGEDHRGFLWSLAQTYQPRVIVMGRGSQGASLYDRERQLFLDVPTVQVLPVVNTVGAGDALFSAFVHFFVGGMEPLEALIRAELFASAKIGVSGASKGHINAAALDIIYQQYESVIRSGIRD